MIPCSIPSLIANPFSCHRIIVLIRGPACNSNRRVSSSTLSLSLSLFSARSPCNHRAKSISETRFFSGTAFYLFCAYRHAISENVFLHLRETISQRFYLANRFYSRALCPENNAKESNSSTRNCQTFFFFPTLYSNCRLRLLLPDESCLNNGDSELNLSTRLDVTFIILDVKLFRDFECILRNCQYQYRSIIALVVYSRDKTVIARFSR